MCAPNMVPFPFCGPFPPCCMPCGPSADTKIQPGAEYLELAKASGGDNNDHHNVKRKHKHHDLADHGEEAKKHKDGDKNKPGGPPGVPCPLQCGPCILLNTPICCMQTKPMKKEHAAHHSHEHSHKHHESDKVTKPQCLEHNNCEADKLQKPKKKKKRKRGLQKCPSRELRCGVLYRGCDCDKRNGLQDDCRRSDCHGSPECKMNPATCEPSQYSNAKHLMKMKEDFLARKAKCKEIADEIKRKRARAAET